MYRYPLFFLPCCIVGEYHRSPPTSPTPHTPLLSPPSHTTKPVHPTFVHCPFPTPQRHREWFIGTGYNFSLLTLSWPEILLLLSTTTWLSLSTTAEMFDVVNVAPIVEDLRKIAINRRIHFGDESYAVHSFVWIYQALDPIHCPRLFPLLPQSILPLPKLQSSTSPIYKENSKKLHWVYMSAPLLRLSFPWQFEMYALSEDAPMLHILLFRYDNISF